MTLISGLLVTHGITDKSPIGAFMAMSAMNFYAIFPFNEFFCSPFLLILVQWQSMKNGH